MNTFLRTIGLFALIVLVIYFASEGFKLANRAFDNERARIENDKEQLAFDKKQLKLEVGAKAKPILGFLWVY